jgi:hypothetical protein
VRLIENELLIREAIRVTLARYAVAADKANYTELSQCFCPSGSLVVAGGLVMTGRDSIANELGRRAKARGHGIRTDVFQLHFVGTSHIVIGTGDAEATTYYQVITEQGPDHAGRYLDRFAPWESQWLLLTRHATMDWVNPVSRFAKLAGNTREPRS